MTLMTHMTHSPVIDVHARARKRVNSADVSYPSWTLPLTGMAVADPAEWLPEFEAWALQECLFSERVFGGLRTLHVAFSEWCIRNRSGPCTRYVFEQLLSDQGF